jgi:hypothetical protein
MSLSPEGLTGWPPSQHERHRPEATLLYQIVEEYWPSFQAELDSQGKSLPHFVAKEFDEYLKCGKLEHGFLRVRCSSCHDEKLVAFSCKKRGFCPSCGARRMVDTAALLVDDVLPHQPIRQWGLSFPFQLRFLLANNPQVMGKVLGIVNRAISTHLIKKAGYKKSIAKIGSVTLIQRFGSALNLNLHFHMLFIDGVYQQKKNDRLAFHRVKAPSASELNSLVATISQRIARHLEKQGLLTRDDENSCLTMDGLDDSVMNELQGHSITYRIAVGPHQGRKVFTLQTIPAWEDDFSNSRVGKIAGFSLHAGVATEALQRKKLERLCRYISRPAVSEKRLALTSIGKVRLVRHSDHLKTPYRDGTTHVIFEPLDFIAKLAAMVPRPRVNLTRFHGVLAPNSKHRINVTPAKRGKGSAKKNSSNNNQKSSAESHKSLTWAERLKRVFKIDVSICSRCGGEAKIIACIEDPDVIKKILDHLDAKSDTLVNHLPKSRAPPQGLLFTSE